MSANIASGMRIAAVAAALSIGGSLQAATTIRLQPDEQSSKDVFVYEFGVPGAFGIATAARVTNLDTATLNALVPAPAVAFGNFLGSANTTPLIGQQGETRAHDTRTLLQFDLSFLNLAPTQVASASINLHALPGLPPFSDPTVGTPIMTEMRSVTQAWSETAVTWETRPAVSGVVGQATQTGVNQWVQFDATALVRAWLAQPSSNFGVELSQPDIVMLSGKPVASLYASAAFANAELRPYLSISAVPEPQTYALMAAGIGLLAVAVRKRRYAGA